MGDVKQHTKGPWAVQLSKAAGFHPQVATKETLVASVISEPDASTPLGAQMEARRLVREADACLIAAAPEMLVELKSIAHDHSDGCDCATCEIIARAEGRS